MQDRNVKFSLTFLRKDFRCLGYISTYRLVRAATVGLAGKTATMYGHSGGHIIGVPPLPHYSISKKIRARQCTAVVLPLVATLLVLNLTCYHFANRRVTMTNVCLVLLIS